MRVGAWEKESTPLVPVTEWVLSKYLTRKIRWTPGSGSLEGK